MKGVGFNKVPIIKGQKDKHAYTHAWIEREVFPLLCRITKYV